METIGFTSEEIDFCLSTVAAILHLGNLTFGDGDIAELKDKSALKTCAKLLSISASALEMALIHPTFGGKGDKGSEDIREDKSPELAAFNRNALSKSIYNRLFNFIIAKVNQSLMSKETIKSFIGVLDIAGFEIFDDSTGGNSFEQLCINFTNEKLQQFYNDTMFKKETEEYARENIDWNEPPFGNDLQATINLIEKPLGLFDVLENAVATGTKDESNLIDQFMKAQDNFKDNKGAKISKDRKDKNKFLVSHYAGQVPYQIYNWLTKNVDPLNDDLRLTCYESKNSLLSKLFEDDVKNKGSKKTKGTRFQCVTHSYKEQLNTLMNILTNTQPHFIRCIIPNHDKKRRIFK